MLGDLADHTHEHGVDLRLRHVVAFSQRRRQVAKRNGVGLGHLLFVSDPGDAHLCLLHVLPFAAIALVEWGKKH